MLLLSQCKRRLNRGFSDRKIISELWRAAQWSDDIKGIIGVGFMENGRRRIEEDKNRELF